MGIGTGKRGDRAGMDCGTAREALSALLDGEVPPCSQDELDAHVTACHWCQEWREAAHLVTRRARLTSAPSMSDGTERILAAVLADRPVSRGGRRTVRSTRAALVAVALAHGTIIVPALVGRAAGDVPLHASRELGSFNLALAVGLLAAAARPAWAKAMLPLVGVAAAFLALFSLVDSANGETTLRVELPHLLTIAGAVLLAVLARSVGQSADGPLQPPGRDDWARRPPLRQLLAGLRAGTLRPPARAVSLMSAYGFLRRRTRSRTAVPPPAAAPGGTGDDDAGRLVA